MRRLGKKGLAWAATRKRLRVRFEKAGITKCEIELPGCWYDYSLGFAHGKKRDNLTREELETLVCLGCGACHTVIEGLKERLMYLIVKGIISERERQP